MAELFFITYTLFKTLLPLAVKYSRQIVHKDKDKNL